MSAAVIVQAFQAMVTRLTQSITPTIIPNMYDPNNKNHVPHEINLVWHFARAVEQQTGRAVVYVEYPCGGSSRIDSVIVTETAWLLVEAKGYITGSLRSLDDQAARLADPQGNLRRCLHANLPPLMQYQWGGNAPVPIWGVLLASAWTDHEQATWLALPTSTTYPTLATYTVRADRNPVMQRWPWWHLLGYKSL